MWLAWAASQGGPWIRDRGDDSRVGRLDAVMPKSSVQYWWMGYLVTHSSCIVYESKHGVCLSIGVQRLAIRVQLVAAVWVFVSCAGVGLVVWCGAVDPWPLLAWPPWRGQRKPTGVVQRDSQRQPVPLPCDGASRCRYPIPPPQPSLSPLRNNNIPQPSPDIQRIRRAGLYPSGTRTRSTHLKSSTRT